MVVRALLGCPGWLLLAQVSDIFMSFEMAHQVLPISLYGICQEFYNAPVKKYVKKIGHISSMSKIWTYIFTLYDQCISKAEHTNINLSQLMIHPKPNRQLYWSTTRGGYLRRFKISLLLRENLWHIISVQLALVVAVATPQGDTGNVE